MGIKIERSGKVTIRNIESFVVGEFDTMEEALSFAVAQPAGSVSTITESVVVTVAQVVAAPPPPTATAPAPTTATPPPAPVAATPPAPVAATPPPAPVAAPTPPAPAPTTGGAVPIVTSSSPPAPTPPAPAPTTTAPAPTTSTAPAPQPPAPAPTPPAPAPTTGGAVPIITSTSASATPPAPAPVTAPQPAPAPSPVASVPAQPASAQIATPRIGVLDYSNPYGNSTRLEFLSRFNWVHLGLWAGFGHDRMLSVVNTIRGKNPNARLSNYTVLVDLQPKEIMIATDPRQPLLEIVERNNWWLRNAAGQKMTQQGGYNNFDVNVADVVKADPTTGKRYPRIKAEWDTQLLFPKDVPWFYIWLDNLYNDTRVAADFLLQGKDQPAGDPLAGAAMRRGHVEYIKHLRELNPGLMIAANAAGDMTSAEYKGLLDNAFLEGQIGKAYSIETWSTWENMMKRYRTVLGNVAKPGEVAFQVYGPSNDMALLRFGLASALQDRGYFIYSSTDATNVMPGPWADEYTAPIGTYVGPLPSNGPIVASQYSNGIALVNTSKTVSGTYNCNGYKRLQGTVDPTVNNGKAGTSSEALAPRQGLLMIKA